MFFAQMLPHLGSAQIGPPEDNMWDYWSSWYAAEAPKPHGFFFTRLIRFPEGVNLRYNAFAFPLVSADVQMASRWSRVACRAGCPRSRTASSMTPCTTRP